MIKIPKFVLYKMNVSKSENFIPVWNKDIIKFYNHDNIPNSLRMLIIGPSGCGKTCLLLQMLLRPNFLDYNNLIIFSPTVNQPEYKLLEKGFDSGLDKQDIINIFRNQDKYTKEKTIEFICQEMSENKGNPNPIIKTSFNNNAIKIPKPDSLPGGKKTLIIFDDCINLKNQDIMKSYFTRGRHNKCNCIYLSQNYYDLDKNNIRGNCNFFIFFKLGKRDKTSIYHDLFSSLLDKEQYDDTVDDWWNKKYGYIALNKDSNEIMNDVFIDD